MRRRLHEQDIGYEDGGFRWLVSARPASKLHVARHVYTDGPGKYWAATRCGKTGRILASENDVRTWDLCRRCHP